MKTCGTCIKFQKWKTHRNVSGLCDLYDQSVSSDCKACKKYKGLRYNRKEKYVHNLHIKEK